MRSGNFQIVFCKIPEILVKDVSWEGRYVPAVYADGVNLEAGLFEMTPHL